METVTQLLEKIGYDAGIPFDNLDDALNYLTHENIRAMFNGEDVSDIDLERMVAHVTETEYHIRAKLR